MEKLRLSVGEVFMLYFEGHMTNTLACVRCMERQKSAVETPRFCFRGIAH